MTTTHRRVHRTTTILAGSLLSGLFLLAGCTSDDAVAARDTGQDETAQDETAQDETMEDEEAPAVVEVEMVDFGYLGLPSAVPAGTQLTVTNSAEEELHELVAFALPDQEQRSIEELTTLDPGELVAALGEPVTVLLAEPGGPQIPAVGDGTLTTPGRYAIMCFIPTGVEPQVYLEAAAATEEGPPQVEGGPPHFVNGMYRELIVE